MKQWLQRIDNNTAQFQNSFANLTEKELNWKPNAETWSIAQNINHLIIINETYYPALAELRAGRYKAPFLGRMGFVVSFFGKTVLDAVQPDRKKKMKTFPIWEPGTSDLPADLLTRFSKHQEELKREIESCAMLVAQGAVISSPANRNIVYKLETAFEVIVMHEQRHLVQAQEVLALLRASTA